MNIVIVGAGAIGSYIANLLTKEENNVILVDSDESRLEALSRDLDVMTRVGSGTDWQLLDDLLELSPHLLLALTGSDEKNLVTCAIAKNLGYPETVARVNNEKYFNRTRLDFERVRAHDRLSVALDWPIQLAAVVGDVELDFGDTCAKVPGPIF